MLRKPRIKLYFDHFQKPLGELLGCYSYQNFYGSWKLHWNFQKFFLCWKWRKDTYFISKFNVPKIFQLVLNIMSPNVLLVQQMLSIKKSNYFQIFNALRLVSKGPIWFVDQSENFETFTSQLSWLISTIEHQKLKRILISFP